MDIVTVLGITWHKASAGDLLLLVAILMVPISLILLLKVAQRLKDRRIHDEQLFLFKLKRLGLSNFQIKIINNLIEILGFSNPNQFLDNPEYFERAIGRFLTHARGSGQDEDSQNMICRDITTIYDKLYFKLRFKKPLKGLHDVDEEQLIYFSSGEGKVFLGKIISRNDKQFHLKIFGSPGDLSSVSEGKETAFHIFRLGDAAYEFVAPIKGRDGAALIVDLPGEIVRGEETRHPYIDVIIPAHISKIEAGAPGSDVAEEQGAAARDTEKVELTEEDGMMADAVKQDKMPCTIYKINDFEAVLRLQEKIDFNFRYILEFMAMDFHFRIVSKIIATKTVEEGDMRYYTVKFDDMSDTAAVVLKKYIYEHL
jgi:hypothetical protein